MAKHLTTYLRLSGARFYFPFNSIVDIHKLLGVAMLFWTICHVCAHACNYHRMATRDEEGLMAMINGNQDMPSDVWGRWKVSLFQSRAGITSILMMLCMLVAYPLTQATIRQRHFNIFWTSHHLLIVMVVLMCVHDSGKTVFWLAIPLLLYVVPRVIRETPRSQTNVIDAFVKPGDALCLRTEKPPSWNETLMGAGMYATIKVPAISLFEWHPFTLTSSPSDPFLEFHIRNSGNFTQKLHNHVCHLEEVAKRNRNQETGKYLSNTSHPEELTRTSNQNDKRGSSDYDEVIDVDDIIEARRSSASQKEGNNWDSCSSLGSLATYMTTPDSLLDSSGGSLSQLTEEGNTRRQIPQWTEDQLDWSLPQCTTDQPERIAPQGIRDLVVHIEGPLGASSQDFNDFPILVLVGAGVGATPMISVLKQLLVHPGKMEGVYFYWTVRDRDAFEWFADVMDDVYQNDHANRLQIRHFLTSAKDDDRDIGAVLLNHARRSKHKANRFDLILGYQAHHQVEVGRPDWKEELSSVKEEAKHLGHKKCGIFLCGPERMGNAISSISTECSDPGFHFHFNRETF